MLLPGRLLLLRLCLCIVCCYCPINNAVAQSANIRPEVEIDWILQTVIGDLSAQEHALESIQKNWRAEFTPMLLEAIYLAQNPQTAVKLIEILQEKTGQALGYDINAWYQWLWNQPPLQHPRYAEFKSQLYGLIDAKFAGYFSGERPATIRLDEVRWGGVRQDGIPPLRSPKMMGAAEADYLADDNIVFAIEINGDARAYPKRILAWHEMFVDVVGGIPVAGVYCTLCGTVIPYKTTVNGVNHALGTSGFLYRSNKLMYDQATQSLWNTLWGTPVIGPLVEQDITLDYLSIVTTTWGEWRRRHPDTQVLSPDTGHQRDYSEGAAYRDYFASDELMFTVPELDNRLKNKDEVLALLFSQHPDQPLAISVDYLAQQPVYQDRIGEISFVVLTDNSGASRVYQAESVRFSEWDGDRDITDADGVRWHLTEAQIKSDDGRQLNRLPAHRAFWFGWFSAYPHTRLVQSRMQ